LLIRILLASTEKNGWVLDPFAGSSTTGIAANLIGRRFLGIEKEQKFVDMSSQRRQEIDNVRIFSEHRGKI
jgi:site-specific DNA-methyltransferase (adenine-specific)